MLRYIALRRFNYIDISYFAVSGRLVMSGQYVYAAVLIVAGAVVSVICEKTARVA